MCNELCTEFSGWCKSFTNTEKWLTLLEALLLVGFLLMFIFTFLHFLFCPANNVNDDIDNRNDSDVNVTTSTTITTTRGTLPPGVECTWTPSHKTSAPTHYYELNTTKATTASGKFNNFVDFSEESDGEEASHSLKHLFMALVKMNEKSGETTFGCPLSVVSEWWALTAASCIDAIEEVESLDAFVMLEGYGEEGAAAGGRHVHAVVDVRMHPHYEGVNVSYDVAALRGDAPLLPRGALPLRLATLIDYHTATVAESFAVVGFGRFRRAETGVRRHVLRVARVWSLGARQCASEGEGGGGEDGGGWAPRHLVGGRRAEAGAARRPLCAGVRHTRGSPCRYCAGTPLLRGRALLGVMSRDDRCGLSCEPALYASVAHLRAWIQSVLAGTDRD